MNGLWNTLSVPSWLWICHCIAHFHFSHPLCMFCYLSSGWLLLERLSVMIVAFYFLFKKKKKKGSKQGRGKKQPLCLTVCGYCPTFPSFPPPCLLQMPPSQHWFVLFLRLANFVKMGCKKESDCFWIQKFFETVQNTSLTIWLLLTILFFHVSATLEDHFFSQKTSCLSTIVWMEDPFLCPE